MLRFQGYFDETRFNLHHDQIMKASFATLLISLALLQTNLPQQHKIVTAAQVNGTWEYRFGTSRHSTIKILALGKQRLKVEFIGLYFYKLPDGTGGANDATGQSIAIIEGNQATFKPDEGEEECLITMKFVSNRLQVKQKGSCGFGLNVTLAGTYRRISSRRPKFEFDDLNEPNAIRSNGLLDLSTWRRPHRPFALVPGKDRRR